MNLNQNLSYITSGDLTMAPDDKKVVVFLSLKHFIKLKDFPQYSPEIENSMVFDLIISAKDEDDFINYCKTTGYGFLNLLNYFKFKISDPLKSNIYYKIYSPIISAAYDEIKEQINTYFNPKISFSGHEIHPDDKKNLTDENNLVIPLF